MPGLHGSVGRTVVVRLTVLPLSLRLSDCYFALWLINISSSLSSNLDFDLLLCDTLQRYDLLLLLLKLGSSTDLNLFLMGSLLSVCLTLWFLIEERR